MRVYLTNKRRLGVKKHRHLAQNGAMGINLSLDFQGILDYIINDEFKND